MTTAPTPRWHRFPSPIAVGKHRSWALHLWHPHRQVIWSTWWGLSLSYLRLSISGILIMWSRWSWFWLWFFWWIYCCFIGIFGILIVRWFDRNDHGLDFDGDDHGLDYWSYWCMYCCCLGVLQHWYIQWIIYVLHWQQFILFAFFYN